MKVLLDTNILIYSEDFVEVVPDLQNLQKIFKKNGVRVYVHPASMKDIENDKDYKRRSVIKSKFQSYPELENPPKADETFIQLVGVPKSKNEEIDNEILHALYRDVVDFFITEDIELIKKASKIGLEDRTFTISSALEYFETIFVKKYPKNIFLKHEFVYNLNIEDPFFNSLKQEYSPDFVEWFTRICREGRKCWVYKEDGDIKTLLILKEENEPIELINKIIPAKRRLKISTLKVTKLGFKLGELLLKITFQYCVENNIFETYLTHFAKEDDDLVGLIRDFGFESVGNNERGEDVYIKELVSGNKTLRAIEISKKYYPSYKDSLQIKKFIIPIIPEFHKRLFPEQEKIKQLTLDEFIKGYRPVTQVDIPGNTIKKAYLCHSQIKKLDEGSIVIFYRSRKQGLTALGVVERAFRSSRVNEILKFIGKRTVYTVSEIEKMLEKPVLCILFRHHFYFKNPINIKMLKMLPPQSILEISHDQYNKIKKLGGLNDRFIVN